MKKILFVVLILFSTNCIVEAQNSVVVSDTRDVPSLPQDYNNEVRFEFKRKPTVDGPGYSHYLGLMTFAPWGDNSGGLSYQLSFSDVGLHIRSGWPNDSNWNAWRRLISENEDHNVGIGTDSPAATLHVANGDHKYGTILAQASEKEFHLYAKTLTSQPAYVETFRLGLKHLNDENNGFISFYRGNSTYGGFLGFSTNGIERVRIRNNGYMGIGTGSPKYLLDVAGTMRAKEIKVDLNGGADFVFEDDYDLKSLEEVGQFIKDRKHLPGIPSAKEMVKDGVGLAEMNKLLLQKVEELTLYILDQEKRIQKLENENTSKP
ncbi:hypothetical protein EYV94_28485 [Puteibacter caeruleilacunae]|nr:hypothetical protein EYV94_28485 [Puteibacter caeruleilacunae]